MKSIIKDLKDAPSGEIVVDPNLVLV